jgi:hypothetical protein
MSMGTLSGNPYLTFLYSIIVEVIALLACNYMLSKLGRKIPYVTVMFLAGLSLFLIQFIPDGFVFLFSSIFV